MAMSNVWNLAEDNMGKGVVKPGVGLKDEAFFSPVEPLTKRELDVLGMIAAGMSNKEIADGLQLTINTVKTHILNIYGKLRVNRRMHAVHRACALKLLNND